MAYAITVVCDFEDPHAGFATLLGEVRRAGGGVEAGRWRPESLPGRTATLRCDLLFGDDTVDRVISTGADSSSLRGRYRWAIDCPRPKCTRGHLRRNDERMAWIFDQLEAADIASVSLAALRVLSDADTETLDARIINTLKQHADDRRERVAKLWLNM